MQGYSLDMIYEIQVNEFLV